METNSKTEGVGDWGQRMQSEQSDEGKEKTKKIDSNHGNLTPDNRDNKRRTTSTRCMVLLQVTQLYK